MKTVLLPTQDGTDLRLPVDFASLPSVLLSELDSAPEIPGIYFILSDDNVILYVGQTSNFRRRMRQHERKGTFRPTELWLPKRARVYPLSDHQERLRLETVYIVSLLPPLNKALMLTVGKKLSEIRWRKKGSSKRKAKRKKG